MMLDSTADRRLLETRKGISSMRCDNRSLVFLIQWVRKSNASESGKRPNSYYIVCHKVPLTFEHRLRNSCLRYLSQMKSDELHYERYSQITTIGHAVFAIRAQLGGKDYITMALCKFHPYIRSLGHRELKAYTACKTLEQWQFRTLSQHNS